eukprot:IDg14414t1
MPTKPVLNPDSAMVKSLVDLGWGDESRIREDLCSPGANVLKVFYAQLERHPMSRRPRLTRANPHHVAPATRANGSAAPSTQQHHPQQARAQPDVRLPMAAPREDTRQTRREMPTSISAPGWTGGLVRQSSYARHAGNAPQAPQADPEEGLQQHLSHAGGQPSWFDSVKNYF